MLKKFRFGKINLDLEQFIAKHKVQKEILKKYDHMKDIHRIYELIDSKSTALLTHVSIMIAACAFFYSSSSNPFFIIETFVYMGIALALLFCLGLSMYGMPDINIADVDTPDVEKKIEDYYALSCKRRVNTYLVSLNLTKVVTVIVLFTILVY